MRSVIVVEVGVVVVFEVDVCSRVFSHWLESAKKAQEQNLHISVHIPAAHERKGR